jgi:hypothetical protein
MFNKEQVNAFVKSLNLSYEWTNPSEGANWIIVENKIKYTPFSSKLKDLRTDTSYTSNTTQRFKELCQELASEK